MKLLKRAIGDIAATGYGAAPRELDPSKPDGYKWSDGEFCEVGIVTAGVRAWWAATHLRGVVGACAVVMKDLPGGVLAAGNPARVVKTRPMDGREG